MSNLKDEIDRLKSKIEDRAYQGEKEDAASFATQRRNDVTSLHRFLAQVAVALMWIYAHLLAPVARALSVPARILWRWYRLAWDKVVYVEDKYRNRLFSKTRAGAFLAASLVFAWFVFIPALVFAFDLGLYFLTVKKDEVVYLTNSQEIIPEENVHSIQGCHDLPCTDENSVYFRIRATYFNEAWSLVHGHGLFFPDYVAAAVPLSISRCIITSYGIRLKFIMRGLDFYPDVLRTECSPLQNNTAPTPE